MRLVRFLMLTLFLAVTAPVRAGVAADATTIELTGVGSAPITITKDMLDGLPTIEQDVTFQTSKGPSSGRYKGTLLWHVLTANKAFERLDHNAELKKTFLVTARDDYQIAFSIGEIHPDFGNLHLMIATQVDGKPFDDGWRIIVPGDTRGARNVREVVKIEVR